MTLTALGIALFLLAAVHFVWVAQRRPIVGPESLFILMALGTYVASAVSTSPAAAPYVTYLGLGVAAFILGTFVSKLVLCFEHRRELAAMEQRPWLDDLRGVRLVVVVGIGAVAVLVSVAYFVALGFYVPLEALRTYFTDGAATMMQTYARLRGETSIGGAYLGLGYVSQFKDILLPLITIVFFFHWRLRRKRSSRNLFAVLLVATVLLSIGTGARYYLAFFGAALTILGMAPFMRPMRFTRRQIVALLVLLLVALSSLTLMMGSRGLQRLQVPVLWAPYQVVERVFVLPSEQRLMAYERFLVDQPPQWGRGSLRELRQILPGRSDTSLSSHLHELIFGSPYGNVSLDVWGSLWYDFHELGVLVAFVLGFVMNAYYIWMLRGSKRFLRLVAVAYAGLILGLATDLQVLVLQGFVTCFLFLLAVEIADSVYGAYGSWRRRGRAASDRLGTGA